MQLEFQRPVALSALHDALLREIHALRPVDVGGERRPVMRVEGDGSFVRLTVPDNLQQSIIDRIAAIVEAHDALTAIKADRIAAFKREARSILAQTDWYIVRNQETGAPIPQAILDYRAAVRAATDRAEQEIAALDSVEAVRAYQVAWPGKPEGVW